MKFNPLIPIGSLIQVDKSKIENLVPKKILTKLPKTINCQVIDYKMTDGMSIGYVLMTEDNQKIWIFNSELNEQTKKEYNIYDTNNSTKIISKEIFSIINKVDYKINGNRSIKTIANPINLIKWLIYTLKNIL
tara:strand:- start:457 stop:855 length:399 start_codon:yes stop_codon:yes gene_type:complete